MIPAVYFYWFPHENAVFSKNISKPQDDLFVQDENEILVLMMHI